jgi:hypothetical protein
MRILLTNAFLDVYAGTQVVVRDLSLELRRQGHDPVVYSPRLGAVAEEVRGCGVQVTDHLTAVRDVPDIIHGHHHPEVMAALLQFPSTPAIYVCHGAGGYMEEPLYHPRILRYVAVDHRCRKRLENVPEIPCARIMAIWNAVDLSRFRPRAPLPLRPKRTLVFSNNAKRSSHVGAVRRACRRARMELDVVGYFWGNAVPNPETILPHYDIVFAKARCALESLAVGSAVVLCDVAGVGPMVSTANYDALRPMNFGAGLLAKPLRAEKIEAEIAKYDARDAAVVSRRVREEAGLSGAARRWLSVYAQVIEEFRRSPQDMGDEFRALAAYLKKWNYGVRLDWEREQLRRLEDIPIAGGHLARLVRSIMRKWTGGYGVS